MNQIEMDLDLTIGDLEVENRMLRARNRRLEDENPHDIDVLSGTVFQWANEAFPDRTDASMFLKMYEEIGEVIRSGGDRLEVADLFILILDYAKRKNVVISEAIGEKLEINRNRDWKLNADGTMSHKDK
jgi:hypothetical protein